MLTKILGVLSLGFGLFLLIGGPGDRVQIEAYGNTARLLGLIMIIAGIVMLMF
jgi:hypothetical protein